MTERDFYSALAYSWFGLSSLVFISLQFLSAPYGRHNRKGWGPSIPNRIAWFIMELPAVCTIAACYLLPSAKHSALNLVFLGVWEIHYIHRTFVYPFRTKTAGKSMPLLIALLAATTNVGIGYLIGRGLTLFSITDLAWNSPNVLIGGGVFFAGFYINLSSDQILFNLRKPGETGYKIPFGGFFRFISSPNYFGEILEWTGFAIMTLSLGAWVFLVWTLSNLLPRAVQNHRWYQENFDNYPKERKVIFPFFF